MPLSLGNGGIACAHAYAKSPCKVGPQLLLQKPRISTSHHNLQRRQAAFKFNYLP
jgi:hypothetical protein